MIITNDLLVLVDIPLDYLLSDSTDGSISNDCQCADGLFQFWTDPCLMQSLTALTVPISAHFIFLYLVYSVTAKIINCIYVVKI